MKQSLIAFCFFLAFLVINIATLTHYGVSWDESTHFMRGSSFLHYIITGEESFNSLPKFEDGDYKVDYGYEFVDTRTGGVVRRSIYQYHPLSFFVTRPEWNAAHPPLAGILAAFSNYIFFQKTGMVPDVYS
jgi:hypothetical protein